MFTIICYVAVAFRDQKTGEQIFEVTLDQRGLILDAPVAIMQDPMYQWLLNDGSIHVVEKKDLKALENDPMALVNAEGKAKVIPASEETIEKAAKSAKGKKDVAKAGAEETSATQSKKDEVKADTEEGAATQAK
jgi:hypothetical protein